MTAPTPPRPPTPTPTPSQATPIFAHRGTHLARRASVLLYGAPKSGKSHNALTFPAPLVIACGANTGTLESTGLPFLTPDTWGRTWEGFRSRILPVLRSRNAHTFISPVAAPSDVQTIVIDEINTLAKLLEDSITGGDPGRKWTHGDFGRLGGELNAVLRDLTHLKNPAASPDAPRYNVIGTCHVRDASDAEGNLVAVQPIILGQTRDVLGAYFDAVFLLTRELESSIDPVTKQPVRQPAFWAYATPPDKFHSRLGLGGSVGPNFPAKLRLTGKTTLRDSILQQLEANQTDPTTNK